MTLVPSVIEPRKPNPMIRLADVTAAAPTRSYPFRGEPFPCRVRKLDEEPHLPGGRLPGEKRSVTPPGTEVSGTLSEPRGMLLVNLLDNRSPLPRAILPPVNPHCHGLEVRGRHLNGAIRGDRSVLQLNRFVWAWRYRKLGASGAARSNPIEEACAA